jgi:hypothetical protein
LHCAASRVPTARDDPVNFAKRRIRDKDAAVHCTGRLIVQKIQTSNRLVARRDMGRHSVPFVRSEGVSNGAIGGAWFPSGEALRVKCVKHQHKFRERSD